MYRESGYILGITSKTNILTTYKRKTMLIHQLPKKRHEPSNYVNSMHLVSNPKTTFHHHALVDIVVEPYMVVATSLRALG
jgi:hypothetical protein